MGLSTETTCGPRAWELLVISSLYQTLLIWGDLANRPYPKAWLKVALLAQAVPGKGTSNSKQST